MNHEPRNTRYAGVYPRCMLTCFSAGGNTRIEAPVIYVPIRHLYICRESSTNQLLFMQNKPNLLDAQMNVNKVLTREYENETLSRSGKNKANTNPIKPNLLNAQMNVNKVLTKYYENESLHRRGKNKPNTNPKQTQSKPISPPPINTQSKTCQKPIMKSPAKILAKSREISGIETARPISDTLVMSHKVCFLLFLRNPPKILCTGGNSCMRNLLLCLYNFVFLTSFFHFQTIHFNLKAEIVYESR